MARREIRLGDRLGLRFVKRDRDLLREKRRDRTNREIGRQADT